MHCLCTGQPLDHLAAGHRTHGPAIQATTGDLSSNHDPRAQSSSAEVGVGRPRAGGGGEARERESARKESRGFVPAISPATALRYMALLDMHLGCTTLHDMALPLSFRWPEEFVQRI